MTGNGSGIHEFSEYYTTTVLMFNALAQRVVLAWIAHHMISLRSSKADKHLTHISANQLSPDTQAKGAT